MPETDLDSLVYVSSAVKLLRPEEIEYLLTRARERNEEYGITGVLLYIGGNFMQYIEGPADNEWNEVNGKAYFINSPEERYLKVSFYGSYVVFELDKEDYQYAFVSGPDLSH